jgi:hypothetical protein
MDYKRYIFIDIYTDMTLTRHPYDSPFLEGMESEPFCIK